MGFSNGYEHRDAAGMIISCGEAQSALDTMQPQLEHANDELTELRARIGNAIDWLEDYVDNSDGISGTEVAYDAVKILRGEVSTS